MSDEVDLYQPNDPIGTLRNIVFNKPLLAQPDLLVLFGELDKILKEDIGLLMQVSTFVERYLADTIAEFAASITHGRTIFERDAEVKEDGEEEEEPTYEMLTSGTDPLALYKKPADVKFLESGMALINALSFYDTEHDDATGAFREQSKSFLNDLRFVRRVYEEIVDTFLYVTADYVDLTRKLIQLDQKIDQQSGDISQLALDKSAVSEHMNAIEKIVGIDRAFLFRLCVKLTEDKKKYVGIRSRIVEPYLRVAYKEAKDHSNTTEQFLDNFQIGSSGLLHAVGSYNTTRKVGFRSYAVWWVRQRILYYIKEESNVIKLPQTIIQEHTYLDKVKERLTSEFGPISMEKLSEVTGYSLAKIKDVYDVMKTAQVYSLDYKIDDDNKTSLSDILVSGKEDDKEQEQANRVDVSQHTRHLSRSQQLIVFLSYGLFEELPSKGTLRDSDRLRELVRQRVARVRVR